MFKAAGPQRQRLSARFATRLRGSGEPLSLVGNRIEPEKDDKTRRMTPEGAFFVGRADRSETLSTAPCSDNLNAMDRTTSARSLFGNMFFYVLSF